MKPPQLDGHVPTRVMRYVGALKTQTGRSRFYVSFLQFAMIAVLFYQDSPTVQRVVPTMYHWALLLVLIGGVLMVADYMVVFPSEITFNQGQAARENRNPTYKAVRENGRRLDELERRLEGDS